ncbi:MAG TPA: redoxin, partial [Thermoanaerobaculia bacterium]|nr:redoxin [Thermoanaerobaculia bacterium]
NSPGNPSNPDPTVEVTWGEATTDEMMIGFMEYEYTNKAEMPTFAVPEHVREQMRRRLESREGAGSSAATTSGEAGESSGR